MTIMQSWKQSLSLLYPRELKPFLLVTVKTVVDLYKKMNCPLSSREKWVLAGTVLALIGLTNVVKAWYLFTAASMILNGMQYACYIVFLLAMRASVGIKNTQYFFDYLSRYWLACVVTILLGLTPLFAIPFLLQFWLLSLLFLFDSSPRFADVVKAKQHAAWFILYNAPLCLAFELALHMIGIVMYSLVAFAMGSWGGFTLALFVYLIMVPMQVALLVNLYIKKFHDQPNLYLENHPG